MIIIIKITSEDIAPIMLSCPFVWKKYWIDLQHSFCLLMNGLKKLSEKY